MRDILPQRKSIRLKDYDYSKEGMYFITICVKGRLELLGKIIDNSTVGANCVRPQIKYANKIFLSEIGIIIENEIHKIKNIYNNVVVDQYVIMPNHIHMILELQSGRTQFAPTISQIIKQFKGSITKQISYSIWQKLFYEHIIRNEKEYFKICEYIKNNPLNWNTDKYNC